MAYSLNLLTTKTLCDAVLAHLAEILRVLRKQKADAVYQQEGTSKLSAEQQTELAFLQADIASTLLLLPTVPASEQRTERENKLRKDTDRRDELLARQADGGPAAVLKAQIQATRLDLQINELAQLETDILAIRGPLPD